MAVEYDPRRPRLPKDLAQRVDEARGQVPFNRWVVQALGRAVGSSEQVYVDAAKDVAMMDRLAAREAEKHPAGSPRSEPFVCPVASCQWPGAKSASEGPCPQHRRNLVPRRV